jgi:AmiR/NasT family two-component response regulator
MAVLVLTRDLNVISRVDGAAARLGAVASSVAQSCDVAARCRDESAELLVIDLDSSQVDVKALIDEIALASSSLPRIVAFGSHVHVEKLNAAREAGCHEVVSRGQFFSQTDALLRAN